MFILSLVLFQILVWLSQVNLRKKQEQTLFNDVRR